MDEILRQPAPGRGITTSDRMGAASPAGFLRRAGRALAGSRFLRPAPMLAVIGAVCAVLVLSSVYDRGYAVTVDGEELGIVTDPAVFELAVDRVEDRVAAILGHEYHLDHQVEYAFTLAQEEEFSPASAFETHLFRQVDAVMQSYTLTVDGELIGAAADQAALNEMLDTLAAPYITENTVSVEYMEDVEISYQYISSDTLQDLSTMEEILSASVSDRVTRRAVRGDTYSGIANDNGMTLEELMALNPDADPNRLTAGDVLTLRSAVPFLSVRTVDTVTYSEVIPFTEETVEDSSMYVDESKILTVGVDGQAEITADITCMNGYEQAREIISTTTVTEPVTQVVAVGTMERPKTTPTGVFKWPLYGTITSKFGYRTIFGTYSFHGGLDIAAPYGTAINASDGGTVIWSGYKGTYGNLIIIDHGNGVHSYYGHCSSLLVSVGDKVYQGQTVALVGSTGRSTGNHCHFEIRINQTRVDPQNYLP